MDAALLLSILVRRLGSSGLIVSAYGLREGLLHRSLPQAVRMQDPLIAAAREEGVRQGRFPQHGDVLDRWIAPLFADESAEDSRLRLAACLLADVGWRAHPDFRPERGLETALHGNWVGIDARGRAMTAHALYANFGGNGVDPVVAQLASPEDLKLAERWGLAIRLGQRLSGGVVTGLDTSALSLTPEAIVLRLARDDTPLYGESIERRHKTLAASFGRSAALGIIG
jgi:exopolyphosphatase/guanosine-5'-triphosphate,3'-diphosphate pyrophosphatase